MSCSLKVRQALVKCARSLSVNDDEVFSSHLSCSTLFSKRKLKSSHSQSPLQVASFQSSLQDL